MGQGGDTRHTFDPSDEAAVKKAEERFKALTSRGYRAAALGKEGRPGGLLKDFDHTAEQTLFIPVLQRG
jgi:hypothetical protein